MSDIKLTELIINKYGKCFHSDFYDTKQDLLNDLPTHYFIASEWEEFGVTLVELGDNNMWSGIVVIRQTSG